MLLNELKVDIFGVAAIDTCGTNVFECGSEGGLNLLCGY